ncbi:MAG: P-loop NTPase [Deltaproteobacteria bacterium]
MKNLISSLFGKKIDAVERTQAAPRAVQPKARIWAVGGCKGGVGKSVIACNLAIMLAKSGKRALLVDADLGAANLHTLIGDTEAKRTLSGFIKSEFDDIGLAIGKTQVPRLDIISGARDSLDVASLNEHKVARLSEGIKNVAYDYVVLDTAPGTSNTILDIFMTANDGLLVVTPEPTSVENAYRFIKCLILRRIKKIHESDESGGLKKLLQKILHEKKDLRPRTVGNLLDELRAHDHGHGAVLKELLKNTNLHIIVNQAKRPEDGSLGYSMERACYDFFGLNVNFIGHIPYDDNVMESIRRRSPLLINYSYSEPAKNMEAIFQNLLRKEIKPL